MSSILKDGALEPYYTFPFSTRKTPKGYLTKQTTTLEVARGRLVAYTPNHIIQDIPRTKDYNTPHVHPLSKREPAGSSIAHISELLREPAFIPSRRTMFALRLDRAPTFLVGNRPRPRGSCSMPVATLRRFLLAPTQASGDVRAPFALRPVRLLVNMHTRTSISDHTLNENTADKRLPGIHARRTPSPARRARANTPAAPPPPHPAPRHTPRRPPRRAPPGVCHGESSRTCIRSPQ